MGLGEDMEYEFRAQDKKIANLQERIERLEAEKDPPTFKIGDRVRIPFETNLPCSGYTGMISHIDKSGVSPMAILVEVRDEHAVRQPEEDGDCQFRFDWLEHDKEQKGVNPEDVRFEKDVVIMGNLTVGGDHTTYGTQITEAELEVLKSTFNSRLQRIEKVLEKELAEEPDPED